MILTLPRMAQRYIYMSLRLRRVLLNQPFKPASRPFDNMLLHDVHAIEVRRALSLIQ